MEAGLNTGRPFVRLILAAAAFLFTMAGIRVLWGAFEREEPHILVMLVFSGSLTLLAGLACLIGFVASFASKGASAGKTSGISLIEKQEPASEKSSAADCGHP